MENEETANPKPKSKTDRTILLTACAHLRFQASTREKAAEYIRIFQESVAEELCRAVVEARSRGCASPLVGAPLNYLSTPRFKNVQCITPFQTSRLVHLWLCMASIARFIQLKVPLNLGRYRTDQGRHTTVGCAMRDFGHKSVYALQRSLLVYVVSTAWGAIDLDKFAENLTKLIDRNNDLCYVHKAL